MDLKIFDHRYLIITVHFCYANCCGVLESPDVLPDACATPSHFSRVPDTNQCLLVGLIELQRRAKSDVWVNT